MGDLHDVPGDPAPDDQTMPDGVSGPSIRRQMAPEFAGIRKEESHDMSRLIAFRRRRTDHRTVQPSTTNLAPTAGLPRYADLAEVVLNRTERTFGRRTDGTLLERFALEAVIDALSSPSPALDDAQPIIPARGPRAHSESNAA
jgi:hypothetical protein